MNKLNFIVLLAAFFLLVSCEFDPTGKNFVEIAPPESNIPVEITLNDVKPTDTIYVYQNTTFRINIKSSKSLHKADVLMDGQFYRTMSNNTLSFIVIPGQLSDGVHKLKVSATFASGTGSLADMMGMEGYTGELAWNIRVITKPENYFTLESRINPDGFMELFWNTPLPESIIERYMVHSGLTQKTDTTIVDPKQKYFVDYGYVCGYVYYGVTIYLKNGYSFTKQLSFDKPAPTSVYFESLGLDNVRVYWKKPFANGRFDLTCDGKIIASGITDTTITIPQLFGGSRQFSVEIRPQNPSYDNMYNKYTAWNWYSQGISLGLPNWELYAYNKRDNIIYTTKYSSLVALDANTLQTINTVAINGNPWGLAYGGKLATAPHNSTVVAMTGEESWIFSDNRFINPIKIPSLPGDDNTRLCALTSNDRFFVVQQNSNVCKIFNSLTGEKITEIPFTYKAAYAFPDFDTVSEDGQYFCASSANGIEVFKINGTTANLLYTDTRQYKGAMFIPSQPDKILLRVGSSLEIRQMPGFNQIQTVDVSAKGALLCNIDPASMNLLYCQKDSLKVCKISNLEKTIFKIRSDETTCKMYNNKILTYGLGGTCFDINPYLGH